MLAGFKAKNHPQQTRYKGSSKEVDDRALPLEDFAPLNDRFRFTIDVAASEQNKKCERYFDEQANGLEQSWAGERVYANPPFSRVRPWIDKAWSERDSEIIVMLLPANRTEQTWWMQGIEPYRDRNGSVLTTEFLSGRIRFLKPGQSHIGPNERPPFGCVLCIWHWSCGPVVKREAGLF